LTLFLRLQVAHADAAWRISLCEQYFVIWEELQQPGLTPEQVGSLRVRLEMKAKETQSRSATFVAAYVLAHSLIQSLIQSFIHSFIRSFIHPSIHPSIHPFIHSFIHSFIHCLLLESGMYGPESASRSCALPHQQQSVALK